MKYISDVELWVEMVKRGVTDFSETFFDKTDFSRYVVRGINFEGCVFNCVDMRTYMVYQSRFNNSLFYDAKTGGRYFTENLIDGCVFIRAQFGNQEDFSDCTFANSVFYLSSFYKSYGGDVKKAGGKIHTSDKSLVTMMNAEKFCEPNEKLVGLVLSDEHGRYLMNVGDTYVNADERTIVPPKRVKIVKPEDVFLRDDVAVWSTVLQDFELFQSIPQLVVATQFQKIQALRKEAVSQQTT